MAESSLRQAVFDCVKRKYKSEIEYLWYWYPGYAVFRHDDNKKWYGMTGLLPMMKPMWSVS